MSTPGAPVSKSQLKKQAKAAAAAAASAATEGPATPTGDGDAAASSSIQPTEAETAAAGGAGSAVVGKRIKQLAKRVQRVSAYEDLEKSKLNPEQVQALAKLELNKAALAELKEVKKQIEIAELEQASTARSQKKVDEQSTSAQIAQAVEDHKTSSASSLPTLLSFFRLQTLLFPPSNSPFAPPPMSDFVRSLGGNEAAAVGKLHYDILTAEDASLAEKLLEGSSEEVIPEITFAQVLEMIKRSSAPVEPTSNGNAEDASASSSAKPIQFGSSLEEPSSTTTSTPAPEPAESASASAPTTWTSSSSGAVPNLAFGSVAGVGIEPEKQPAAAAETAEEPKEAAAAVEEPAAEEPRVEENEVVGKPGMEGEGEQLAADEAFQAPEPVVEEAKKEEQEEKVEEPKAAASSPAEQTEEVAAESVEAPAASTTKLDWADEDDDALPPIPFGGAPATPAASAPAPKAWGKLPSAPAPSSQQQQAPRGDAPPSGPRGGNAPRGQNGQRAPRAPQQPRAAPPPQQQGPIVDEDGFTVQTRNKSRADTGNWRDAGAGGGGPRGGRGGGRGADRGGFRGDRGRGGRGGRGGAFRPSPGQGPAPGAAPPTAA